MKVLILGVGPAQVDAIRYCKSRGHEVFGLSYKKEGQGLAFLDHFDIIDIADRSGVLEYARDKKIDLVYSIGSDIAMPTVAYVSEKLRTPCFFSEEVGSLLQNKGNFRQFLRDHNLSQMFYQVSGSYENLVEWKLFPAVIKPVDSQGQRGVAVVRSQSELRETFPRSISFSTSKKVIIEQFIDGSEFSINTFVRKGKLLYCFISDRYVADNVPGGIAKGHGIPSQINGHVQRKATSFARKIITALGIENGPVYFQMKCSADYDVFCIEVTPRLDGCHLWRLIKLKYGVDLLDLSFQLLESNMQMPCSRLANSETNTGEKLRLDFFLQRPNTLFQKLQLNPKNLLHFEWYYAQDMLVQPMTGYLEKTGYKITRCDED